MEELEKKTEDFEKSNNMKTEMLSAPKIKHEEIDMDYDNYYEEPYSSHINNDYNEKEDSKTGVLKDEKDFETMDDNIGQELQKVKVEIEDFNFVNCNEQCEFINSHTDIVEKDPLKIEIKFVCQICEKTFSEFENDIWEWHQLTHFNTVYEGIKIIFKFENPSSIIFNSNVEFVSSRAENFKFSSPKKAKLEAKKETLNIINKLFKSEGFKDITEKILKYLDHNSQLSCRLVCHSWKDRIDPFFWIKKFDEKKISKENRNIWVEIANNIQRGSQTEKNLVKYMMHSYANVNNNNAKHARKLASYTGYQATLNALTFYL